MKQTVISVIAHSFIITSIIILCNTFNTQSININTREIQAQVVSIDNQVVTVEDITGNLWEFESDNYYEEEAVLIKFYTLGTDTSMMI